MSFDRWRSLVDGAEIDVGAAIPDSGMFQSPIYQFWAGAYEGSDQDSPFDYPEVLAELPDATAAGAPIFNSDQAGFAAGEYDGVDDGHDISPDAQLPTGDDPWTLVALVYVRDGSGSNGAIGWGNNAVDESMLLRVRDGDAEQNVWGQNLIGDSVPTEDWVSLAGTYDGSTLEVLSQGSLDNSTSLSDLNIQDENHSLAYRSANNDAFLDGFVAEVIVSDVAEPEQAFSDYHQDRLG